MFGWVTIIPGTNNNVIFIAMSPCDRVIFCLLVLFCSMVFFQSNTCAQVNSIDTIDNLPSLNKVLEKFNVKSSKWAESFYQEIARNTQKQLTKLYALENSLLQEIDLGDNNIAELLKQSIQIEYAKFHQRINTIIPGSIPYQPMLDSISGIVSFQKLIPGNKKELLELETHFRKLKQNWSISEELRIFSNERQSFLKDFFGKCDNISAQYKNKYLRDYSKQLAIYKETMEEWRKEINDPAKYERLALLALNKLPAFKSFMQENGELSRLFGNPSSAISNIAGLQTRSSLMQVMQQRGLAAGINVPLQHQFQSAQNELNNQKSKLLENKTGEITDDDFTDPNKLNLNTQKTKPFLKRLELGIDFQSGIRQYQFPSSNAIAIISGYKISDRFTAGFGLEYKFSLGESFQHLRYSSDGIGFRSFLDFKMSAPSKGHRVLFSNIWFTSGYEKCYWANFISVPELKFAAWQTSLLFGLTKKVEIKKKILKIQCLYDFLKPKSSGGSPIVFRFGYSF